MNRRKEKNKHTHTEDAQEERKKKGKWKMEMENGKRKKCTKVNVRVNVRVSPPPLLKDSPPLTRSAIYIDELIQLQERDCCFFSIQLKVLSPSHFFSPSASCPPRLDISI